MKKKSVKNSYNRKNIVIITCSIVVILLIILINIFDSDSQNNSNENNTKEDILYKYDIEKMDYSMFKNKFYEVHYTATRGNSNVTGESTYILNEDGSCMHSGKLEGTDGVTSVSSSKCNYVIYQNFIAIIETDTNVFEPKGEYKKWGANSSTEEETITITGKFVDNWKYLEIGNLKYSSKHYNTYLEENIEENLIDPNTIKDYTLDGASFGNNSNSIDVSSYKVVDKTKEEVKYDYDNSCNVDKDFASISVDDYLNLYKNPDYSFVYLYKDDCKYCEVTTPIFKILSCKYNVDFYGLNIGNASQDVIDKFIRSDNHFSEGFSMPSLLVVGNNSIKDIIQGIDHTGNEFEKLIKSNVDRHN